MLKFNADGTFKILQITDLHFKNLEKEDYKTIELVDKLILEENPDFVAITGDTIRGRESLNPQFALKEAIKPIIDLNVPFAAVLGNHDNENNSQTGENLSKDEYIDILKTNKLCLVEKGDYKISGMGNYYLPIYTNEKKVPWVMFFLDSGSTNAIEGVPGYDFIKRDQIEWYVNATQKLKKEHGDFNALVFFHIPIPEFKEVWETKECYGNMFEAVESSRQNSGLFSAMLEMGNVKGVFVGHEHINDFWGELYGIKLLYGRATGYNTYGKEGYERGARIISISQDNVDFEHWIRLESGDVIINQTKHMPENKA